MKKKINVLAITEKVIRYGFLPLFVALPINAIVVAAYFICGYEPHPISIGIILAMSIISLICALGGFAAMIIQNLLAENEEAENEKNE